MRVLCKIDAPPFTDMGNIWRELDGGTRANRLCRPGRFVGTKRDRVLQ
jgi:hypothetical protein